MTEEHAKAHAPGVPRPSPLIHDAAGAVRRGPAGPLHALGALPHLLSWLERLRTHLTSPSEELIEYLKTSEWFLDNYILIQRSVRQVREDLPREFFGRLPVLTGGQRSDLPRIYVLAGSLLEGTELVPDSSTIKELVREFQLVVPLSIAELWSLPSFLRLCVLEELSLALARTFPKNPAPLAAPISAAARGLDDEERAARCIRTLRTLDLIDWKTLFIDCSLSERVLEGDPAKIYARADFETRDRCRKQVEEIAWRTRNGELVVAQAAIDLALAQPVGSLHRRHVGHFLIGSGRLRLEQQFGYQPPFTERLRRLATARPVRTLTGGFAACTLLVLAIPMAYLARLEAGPLTWLVALALAIVPASSLGVAMVQWFLTNLLPPRVLPKLEFKDSIDPELRTLVAVPCLLGSAQEIQDLIRQLELHYLRNPFPGLAFALLSDWTDAPQAQMPDDSELLNRTVTAVRQLNQKYGDAQGGPFHLLHRARKWNPSEDCWMGWERKRGKLEQLNELLLETNRPTLNHVAGDPKGLKGVHYVITLDAGTILPPGAALRLIGTIAHPLNQAEFDEAQGRVTSGYTVIQPRVEISPTATVQTLFTRIFSGDAAIDIYTRAVSDIYQDLAGEGLFVGKGIYDVAAFSRSLEGRVPDNAIVSHDHFEGLHGRAALASDIVLYEDYPPQYLAYARRMHRWVRGDWQLLPWLGRHVPSTTQERLQTQLSLLGRWVLFDNLRRSLLAPALLLMLAAAWLWLPGQPHLWTALAICAPAGHVFTALMSSLSRGPRRMRVRPWLVGTARTARQNVGRWALFVVFLAHEAILISDAILRTLFRLVVSRRRLLEWRSAEHTAQILARRRLRGLVWTEMFASPLLALGLLAAVLAQRKESLPWAAPLLTVWIIAPEIARWISRPSEPRSEEMDPEDISYLRQVGRRTWLFFENFVGPIEQWLPPDNYQEQPRGKIAHRTSPTNIGMYMISSAAAYDFGWHGAMEMLIRMRNTQSTLERMETFRGHTLNWYDTRTLEPLLPRYVSTVDSGNLAAALLIAQQTCAEAATEATIAPIRWTGLLDNLDLLADGIRCMGIPKARGGRLQKCYREIRTRVIDAQTSPLEWWSILHELSEELMPQLDQALFDALQDHEVSVDARALHEVRIWVERTHHHLQSLRQDLEHLTPWMEPLATPARGIESSKLLEELLQTLDPAARLSAMASTCKHATELLSRLRREAEPSPETTAWCERMEDALVRGVAAAESLQGELLAFGDRAESCVRAMDFGLLFDEESRLLYIGYDVTSGRLDPNHYDLLASEARIASFLAIAKGDVPVKHWFFLGRPTTRVHGHLALVSWGGTMFEYLMPALLMHSAERTLLTHSCRTAIRAQLNYARGQDVPWGISESGFYEFDADSNYQYRAFGVPGLGFNRGLAENLVVAPYASAIALEFRPRDVIQNLRRLQKLGALGLRGFYESIDFTAERTSGGIPAIVRSHMAHHQGMILAAMDNFVCGRPLERRFHATSLAQTAELLLHELVPAGPSPQLLREDVLHPPPPRLPRREPEPWRPVTGGLAPETHVLSNGRLTTGLTEGGGGWMSWRGLSLTRWSADSTGDRQGTWIYVHDEQSGELWSAGHSPTGNRTGDQQVIFQAHAAEIQRREHGLLMRMEVTIAPREDAEIRLITLTNESDTMRRITLSTCLEPVLAPGEEDARHPAFSKLFIESEYLDQSGALLFRRRKRSPEERPVVLYHGLIPGEGVQAAGHETDRARFLGRGQSWDRPQALTKTGGLSGTTGAMLDPVSVLQAKLELRPGASGRLAFVIHAAGSAPTALESAQRLRSLEQIEWIFQDARAAAGRELRSMRIPPRLLPLMQRLTTLMLYPHAAFRDSQAEIDSDRLGKPGLWGRGISGDLPLLLVELGDAHNPQLLTEVLLTHRWWRRCGIPFEVVLMLSTPSGYAGEADERINRLIAQSGSTEWRNRRAGIFVVHADQVNFDELRTLRVAARVILRAADGRLGDQLAPREPPLDHSPRFVPAYSVSETSEPTPALKTPEGLLLYNGLGGFSPDGHEYVIHLEKDKPTPAPWCNVLSNADFGCLVSESGLGATWSINSAERRLTPWRNDPVSDEPSEVVYVRDEETGAFWTPTPLPAGGDSEAWVRHGAGWSEYSMASHGLHQNLRVFVPRSDPIKVVSMRLRNTWSRSRRLTLTYYAELVLGMRREKSAPFTATAYDAELGVLLARNAWAPEHAERVTFLASDGNPHGFSVDRFEFLGRNGSLARPSAMERWGLSGSLQPVSEPCHVLAVHIDLQPGEERTVHFLFGDGNDRSHALELVRRYRNSEQRTAAWTQLKEFWDETLGSITVQTPEPAMNLALNRWLLYQSVSSRIEGRIGLYQSSGAFGFRDQLQDVMALVHAAPERVRAHVLEAARHQFDSGDVLHWWHPPLARGVRTRCSDDLLWLPFVACHYARSTGDLSVFQEQIPFLAGDPLEELELQRYGEYATSPEQASLLEHCRRALMRGITQGPHGLPLIGTCDWNDGMDRVGPRGLGESVWLAWFAIATVDAFAAILIELEHGEKARMWSERARALARAVEASAWDGSWYLRAWFDDGTALGSANSGECSIDLIAQAWAAISGAADPDRLRLALDSAATHLTSGDGQIVRLLWPPFDKGREDPGYIKAYPPGVRENGGQYTHAATWLGWAFATLGSGAEAERIFRRLNPLEHARSLDEVKRYRVEPYVVAADVYAGFHEGRGGWTWYTGAAAWLWRLGVEAILGLRREGGMLRLDPCIPPAWEGFQATVRTPLAICHVVVKNPGGPGHGVARVLLDGQQQPDTLLALDQLRGSHEVEVTLVERSEALKLD